MTIRAVMAVKIKSNEIECTSMVFCFIDYRNKKNLNKNVKYH
jgi:hypothetical protein